ncbi:MAG TPA: MarR family transcriptional regulator [Gammaproteobacteria bacterium]|nr:MarR family transcriptional regulator [Gammaproteobacteria bacterium]
MTTTVTLDNASQQDCLPLMRALVAAWQAFTGFDARQLREYDLTPSQADVVFTLGNTDGLTFGEIGEHTLITKGTLTGVVDRLAEKGLVRRVEQHADRRCTRVVLTPRGVALFERAFPRHIGALQARFEHLDPAERREATRLLEKIAAVFQ